MGNRRGTGRSKAANEPLVEYRFTSLNYLRAQEILFHKIPKVFHRAGEVFHRFTISFPQVARTGESQLLNSDSTSQLQIQTQFESLALRQR